LLKEKAKNKKRIVLVIFVGLVLSTTFWRPNGIIDFDKLSANILVADREGVAGCGTTLKLKKNKRFVKKEYCFGIREVTGDYAISNDTFYFKNISSRDTSQKIQYAIIRRPFFASTDKREWIILYRDQKDTMGDPFVITENHLVKK
jgi:hypothetical protein